MQVSGWALALCIVVAADSSRSRLAVAQTVAPSAGRWSQLVYDDARKRVVLVNAPADRAIELWSWDGAKWSSIPAQGPAPRSRLFAAAAFNSRRGVLVMSGGITADGQATITPLNETWEFDGTRWQQKSAGPARYAAAMAFDVKRGKMFLFGGGEAGTTAGDAWTWDGQTWEKVSARGPSARGSTTLTYDAGRYVLVLHGGHLPGPDGRNFGDVWEWNGEEWKEITFAPPTPGIRVNAATAYDSQRRATILVAGGAMEMRDAVDTWSWNGTRWTRLGEQKLGQRDLPGLAYDSARQRLVLFGGLIVPGPPPTPRSDTWEWDGDKWVCLAGCR